MSGACMSPCGRYRYSLDRGVAPGDGPVFAYFGVNGSTAGPITNDHTVRKWIGFTLHNGGSRFIVGNAFAYRATDVRELARVDDPIGPDNDLHLDLIIQEADILVPCWGSRGKVPRPLRYRFDDLREKLFASGKPVRTLGFTSSGDPKHCLTLAYATPLTDWIRT